MVIRLCGSLTGNKVLAGLYKSWDGFSDVATGADNETWVKSSARTEVVNSVVGFVVVGMSLFAAVVVRLSMTEWDLAGMTLLQAVLARLLMARQGLGAGKGSEPGDRSGPPLKSGKGSATGARSGPPQKSCVGVITAGGCGSPFQDEGGVEHCSPFLDKDDNLASLSCVCLISSLR